MRRILLALLCTLLMGPALASPSPDEQLPDPAMEHRARHLYQALRCVVCQSQSIDESNAALAEDMRIVVRERLAAGEVVAPQEVVVRPETAAAGKWSEPDSGAEPQPAE